MNAPIQAGDLCEVINGVLGKNSPNLGLIVKVLNFQGEDPTYGRIWRCSAEFAERWADQPGADQKNMRPTPPGVSDFAQDWLKKIEPPKLTTPETETTDEEVKA